MNRLNIILLNINAYAGYPGKDMAGAMRVRNIFDPLVEDPNIQIANLIPLNLLELQYQNDRSTQRREIDCLSIGYTKIYNPLSLWHYWRKGCSFISQRFDKKNCNIIYNYESPDIRNIIFLLYGKWKGYRIIVDIVEDKAHDHRKRLNDKIQVALSLMMLKSLRHYADAVLVISSHLFNKLQAYTQKKLPVILLPVSVNMERLLSQNPEKKQQGPLNIFYGGSFAPKDGLDQLIKAFKSLKHTNRPAKLILSGRGRPEDMKIVLDEISNHPGIEYRGFLSTADYFQTLQEADICCMTRNNSAFANAGFPFKLGEFLAAGKVVIASEVGDVKRYLTHLKNSFLIQPGNAEAIAEALTECINRYDELSKSMGPAAREIAEIHFSAKKSSNRVKQVIASLCGKP
jgi:glycosyltransferase involved in cell wall biosynthesis